MVKRAVWLGLILSPVRNTATMGRLHALQGEGPFQCLPILMEREARIATGSLQERSISDALIYHFPERLDAVSGQFVSP